MRVTDRAAGKRVGERMPKALLSLLGNCRAASHHFRCNGGVEAASPFLLIN